MKIRSRGLGKRELDMNLKEFQVKKQGKEVILIGVTHAPVTWETNIRVRSEDIGGILKIALNPKVLVLGLRWLLRLKTPETTLEEPTWERKRASLSSQQTQDSTQNLAFKAS